MAQSSASRSEDFRLTEGYGLRAVRIYRGTIGHRHYAKATGASPVCLGVGASQAGVSRGYRVTGIPERCTT